MTDVFRSRPAEVRARQYTGDNDAEIGALIGACWEGRDPELGRDDPGVQTSRHCTWETVYVGDWIVLHPGGEIERLDGEDFAARFESI